MPQNRSSNPDRRHPGPGRLRIIGGRWRGRKLTIPDVEGLRPTGDRVRETLFNWLNAILPGANCLDLFAGSGALGLEALSRGASAAVLVEHDQRAADSLRRHCQTLAANAEVVTADAVRWLNSAGNRPPFDIVFLDPPFDAALLNSMCQQLELANLLADGAYIYVETSIANAPAVPANWQLTRQKSAGQVLFLLYRRAACPA